jgi:GNAT superfamily N-acetyltransferase
MLGSKDTTLDFREINAVTTLKLRCSILRPHQTEVDCIYPGDNDANTKHFGAFINSQLVGIISIYKQDCIEFYKLEGYQIRAMATIEEVRGKGIGLKLLQLAELYAFSNKAAYIWANARVSAKVFYQKAGYEADLKEFVLKDIGPHVLVSNHNPNR